MIKYTHPNLLFISWQHYINKMKRAEIKREYGITVDGHGNKLKEKDKKTASGGTNTHMLLTNSKVSVQPPAKKEYRDAKEYKPTGNLIYNNALLKKIEDKTRR